MVKEEEKSRDLEKVKFSREEVGLRYTNGIVK